MGIPAIFQSSVDPGTTAPDFLDSLVFFDLAGTLLETGARLSEARRTELRRFSAWPKQIVLAWISTEKDSANIASQIGRFCAEPQL